MDSKRRELKEVNNLLDDGKDMVCSAAVKKGTYYLAVEGNKKYEFRYTFKSAPKISKEGKSLERAVSLKKVWQEVRVWKKSGKKIKLVDKKRKETI